MLWRILDTEEMKLKALYLKSPHQTKDKKKPKNPSDFGQENVAIKEVYMLLWYAVFSEDIIRVGFVVLS